MVAVQRTCKRLHATRACDERRGAGYPHGIGMAHLHAWELGSIDQMYTDHQIRTVHHRTGQPTGRSHHHACAAGSFFNPRSINLESIQSSTNPSSRRTESNNFSCGLWDSPIHGLGLLLRTRGARTRPRGDRLRRQEVTHDGPAVIVCADRRAAQ
jgi:hypothetical protein